MAATPTIMDEYHQLNRAGEADDADKLLSLALQVPSYRAEAQLCRGILALQQQDYAQAFLWLAQAAETLPQRPDVTALLGRAALAQNQSTLARKLLEAAWRRHPNDAKLRITLWQARIASQPTADTIAQMRSMLRYIDNGDELRYILRYLAKQRVGIVGATQYQPKNRTITGWAINLHNPHRPAALRLYVDNKIVDFSATQPHSLLTNAGYPPWHGKFSIKLPAGDVSIRLTDNNGDDLDGSPLASTAIFPGVPGDSFQKGEQESLPAAAKINADSMSQPNRQTRRKRKKRSAASPAPKVDVLIPVYEGLEETLACVASVLRYRKTNRTPHQIIVLDDASPNSELTQALEELAKQGRIIHVLRSINLGFIRNMNRGMALHPDRDVVWLNADTQVHRNWLDRLRNAAYKNTHTATACPLSNNGELLSYPTPLKAHPMPNKKALAVLDSISNIRPEDPIAIETGCGFCMYIKRAALNAVGYLDEVELIRGYGEETDWCLRAQALGWQHVAATNVFVAHKGNVSFKDEKALHARTNNTILRKRYPLAKTAFNSYAQRNPLAPVHQTINQARLRHIAIHIRNLRKKHNAIIDESYTLYITGQQRELAGLPSINPPILLTFLQRKASQATVILHIETKDLPLSVEYHLPRDTKLLLQNLKELPLERIVYDQTLFCPESLLQLPEILALPYVVRNLPYSAAESSATPKSFLASAKAIEVPYPAQLFAYVDTLPYANIAVLPTPPLSNEHDVIPTGTITLLADTLDDALILRDWIPLLKRTVRHSTDPILLLTLGKTPRHNELITANLASYVPELEGVSPQDILAMTKCLTTISLNDKPDASWFAPALASNLGLSLFAPNSLVAQQAGARPLSELTGWIQKLNQEQNA